MTCTGTLRGRGRGLRTCTISRNFRRSWSPPSHSNGNRVTIILAGKSRCTCGHTHFFSLLFCNFYNESMKPKKKLRWNLVFWFAWKKIEPVWFEIWKWEIGGKMRINFKERKVKSLMHQLVRIRVMGPQSHIVLDQVWHRNLRSWYHISDIKKALKLRQDEKVHGNDIWTKLKGRNFKNRILTPNVIYCVEFCRKIFIRRLDTQKITSD